MQRCHSADVGNLSLDVAASSFIVVLVFVALLAANMPFVSEKVLGVWTLRRAKSLRFRFAEVCVFYGLVGGVGLLMERHSGQVAPQGWEFFAITVFLFLTLSFPGFVFRYLLILRT